MMDISATSDSCINSSSCAIAILKSKTSAHKKSDCKLKMSLSLATTEIYDGIGARI